MRHIKTLIILFFLAICGGMLAQEVTARDYEKEAQSLIKRINELINEQIDPDFDELLIKKMENLDQLGPMIEDPSIKKQIDQVHSNYDTKKKKLKEEARKRAIEERNAQLAIEKAKEDAQRKQDSISKLENDKKLDQQRQDDKKRQTRLLVIGIIVAAVFFGSSQLIQHLRNRRTQRDIMQMQQNPSGVVEKKIKRKIQGEVSKATHQIQYKGKKTIRKSISKLGNTGKGKNISI